jgi:hypothetical protein
LVEFKTAQAKAYAKFGIILPAGALSLGNSEVPDPTASSTVLKPAIPVS